MENKTTLMATGFKSGACTVEFTESGYTVVSDDRDVKVGYLYITYDSADSITEACRNSIICYMFNHKRDEPGVGATTQKQYLGGLSREDAENIGNNGKTINYNR